MPRIFLAALVALLLLVPATAFAGSSTLRSVVFDDSNAATDNTLARTDDDELEVKGTLTFFSPARVESAAGLAVCEVPPNRSLSGFALGDFVEMTCDLEGGTWVLRALAHEDDDEMGRDDDGDDGDDDNSGPGNGDGEDNSGPGGGDDDDEDDEDDNRGPGGDGDEG